MEVYVKNKKLPTIVEEVRDDADLINENKALFSAWVNSLPQNRIVNILVDGLCDEFLSDHPHIRRDR